MKRIINIFALAALVISSVSCSKSRAEQMAMAENVNIQCNPEVLAAVAGNIPATVTVTYPDGYFYPKATMEVTPVLVYEGGEQVGPTYKYQGEKIKENNKVVPFKGGSVSEKMSFKYVDGCQKCHLELRSKVTYGKNTYNVDPIKVADGCNTTYMLADLGGVASLKEDGYQAVIAGATEGQILYDVNSANVKKSELKSSSIEDMKAGLKDAQANERVTVKGTRIIAYASPEGGEKLNAELSDKRAGTAEKAWTKMGTGLESNSVEVQSIGQDWEGFKEAVANSNIQDKHLILRVLSMYNDPAVRESEIKNMSAVYTEISKQVFPELRRARFITDTEFKNYTDEELASLSKNGSVKLDETALLHLATIAADNADKAKFYEAAIKDYNSDVARYNLANIRLAEGKTAEAATLLNQIKNADADVVNAKGVVALRQGNNAEAVKLFTQSGTDAAMENLAIVDIANGDYAAAAKKLQGKKGNNAVIANLLNGDIAAASKAIEGTDATADYLRAVLAARKGDTTGAKRYLADAVKKNPSLKARAEKDVELASIAK